MFNSHTSNSRGTAILFNNNTEYKVHKIGNGDNGNLIALDVTIDSKRITLVNLYSPNNDTPTFFEEIDNIIESLNNSYFILITMEITVI